MSRLVQHDATGPRKLDESDLDAEKGDIAVCQCGLSESYPFCDGSHRATRDEGDACYRYEGDSVDGERRVVTGISYADADKAERGDAEVDDTDRSDVESDES